MSKRAIRTSRKRVNAILRAERVRLLESERERIREEEKRRAGMIGTVCEHDDFGRFWLTPRPPRHGYVQVMAPEPLPSVLQPIGPPSIRGMYARVLTFRSVIMMAKCPTGATVCWTNWEPSW